MRVDLRRGDIGMTKQFLHDTQISAASEHVCGEAVTEHVGVYVIEAGTHCQTANDLPYSDTFNWTASV